MSLRGRIDDDYKAAFKSGNRFVADSLKLIKAEILNQEVKLGKREAGLDDAEIEQLLARELKKRREAAEIYAGSGRQEVADKELAEAELISQYLPEQVSEDELAKLVDEIIAVGDLELTPANQGKIIGAVKAKAGNQADGATIAKIIQAKLKS